MQKHFCCKTVKFCCANLCADLYYSIIIISGHNLIDFTGDNMNGTGNSRTFAGIAGSGQPFDLEAERSLLAKDHNRHVEDTIRELEYYKVRIAEAPLLYREKEFHLRGCDISLLSLQTNPTPDNVERAKHDVLKLATIFALIDESTTDMVTGLANRKAILKETERVISDLEHGEAGSAAIVFMDLNKFKPINDELGHDQGDAALKLVGEKIKATVRKSDVVARVGGDEFVVLLHHNNPDHDFAIEQSHLQALFDKGIIFKGPNDKEYPIGAAIGVEKITKRDAPDTAIKAADAKMFESKRGSRGMGHLNLTP